jgi:hypothetical protein
MAVELSPTVGIADSIAPGIGFGTRTTKVRAVWVLRIQAQLVRVPLLGRAFRAKTAS